jgi:hypothetical protein
MHLRPIVLACAAFLLAGCFDARYDLTLHNDGSGKVSVDLVLDRDLSRNIQRQNGGAPEQLKTSPLGRNARASQRFDNGSLVMRQALDFRSLAEVTGGDITIEVQDIGRSYFGVKRNRIRFAVSHRPTDAPRSDSNAMIGQIITRMFEGHELRLAMHLPCTVESADSLTIDGKAYPAKISATVFGPSTVEWHVPMTAVMAMQSQTFPHDFVATCWSFKGITPSRNTPRR